MKSLGQLAHGARLERMHASPLWLDHGFRNRHPIYGRFVTSLVLPEAPLAEGVKIEIVKPNTRYAWTLAEINVFVGGSSTGRSTSVR